MANKLKKSITPEVTEKPVNKAAIKPKPANTSAKEEAKPRASQKFKKEREEKIDLKKLAKDERTWKIIGAVSLLMAIFLFISFVSYFFTRNEDYSQIHAKGISFLFDGDSKVSNLLGRLGAFASHGLIRQGFGLASFLFCCFFFVVGINLLSNRKVFSIWRNLRYVTVGLLILSVTLSFLFSSFEFPFGGSVGDMINNWLKAFLGTIGAGCLLLVTGVSYLIWQLNPNIHIPIRNTPGQGVGEMLPIGEEEAEMTPVITLTKKGAILNDLYADTDQMEQKPNNPNKYDGDGAVVLNINKPIDERDYGFSIVKKDKPREDDELTSDDLVAGEIAGDILHKREEVLIKEFPAQEPEEHSEQLEAEKRHRDEEGGGAIRNYNTGKKIGRRKRQISKKLC